MHGSVRSPLSMARWPVIVMHHHESPAGGTRPASRRRILEALLRASSTYAVQVDSTAAASPVAKRITTGRLLGALASQRAIFLGEHHPDERDHLLQAALLRRLLATRRNQPIAVGLEAVRQRSRLGLGLR